MSKIVCAVVVLYYAKPDFIKNITKLASQVNHIFCIDNAAFNIEALRAELAPALLNKIIYIRNKTNLGIAAALNLGVKKSLEYEADWVLTLDQDSKVYDSYVKDMIQASQSLPNIENLGLISPIYKDPDTGVISSFAIQPYQNTLAPIKITMTSGNMVKASTFKRIGMYDKSLFIDYVDNDFCLRCLKMGLKMYETSQVCLSHKLGDTKVEKILGRKINITHHSPIRKYYLFRNRILLYRRYYLNFLPWACKDMVCAIKEIVKICIFERSRLQKVRYILWGILHGILGRTGKHSNQA